jgi:hypothetical protein
MRKMSPAASPEEYLESIDGWRLALVTALRASVRRVPGLDEVVKWGHLVYRAQGPVLLIRAEESRVLLGFWRGQRLCSIEPRLKPGGRYEMATLDLREDMTIRPATIRRLVQAAVQLNETLGDPTLAAMRSPSTSVRKR